MKIWQEMIVIDMAKINISILGVNIKIRSIQVASVRIYAVPPDNDFPHLNLSCHINDHVCAILRQR